MMNDICASLVPVDSVLLLPADRYVLETAKAQNHVPEAAMEWPDELTARRLLVA